MASLYNPSVPINNALLQRELEENPLHCVGEEGEVYLSYALGAEVESYHDDPCSPREVSMNLLHKENMLQLRGPIIQERLHLIDKQGKSYCFENVFLLIRLIKGNPFLWSLDEENWYPSSLILLDRFTGSLSLLADGCTQIDVIAVGQVPRKP